MSVLRLWGRLNSINVQKVLWTLEELGLAYESIPAGGDFGGLNAPDFRDMNPHGRIPVIDDDGTIVWESNAIVRYLCAEYDAGGLWPGAARPRALADMWMEWTATTLQPSVSDHFWGWYRTPAGQRDEPRNAELWRGAGEAWAKLDAELSQRAYVAGERLTMADIPAGALAYRYFTLDLPRPPLPHVAQWHGRLADRPAYRRAVMRPYDDLLGRLAP